MQGSLLLQESLYGNSTPRRADLKWPPRKDLDSPGLQNPLTMLSSDFRWNHSRPRSVINGEPGETIYVYPDPPGRGPRLMGEVIVGTSAGYRDLSKEDRLAIARYLKAISPIRNKIGN